MRFHEMIGEAIDNAGLSLRELARRCQDHGESVTHSYLSKVRSGACPPPSDKLIVAMAKALGRDPLPLALQAYLERAPETLRIRMQEIQDRIAAVS